jgi:hypothetical protein
LAQWVSSSYRKRERQENQLTEFSGAGKVDRQKSAGFFPAVTTGDVMPITAKIM